MLMPVDVAYFTPITMLSRRERALSLSIRCRRLIYCYERDVAAMPPDDCHFDADIVSAACMKRCARKRRRKMPPAMPYAADAFSMPARRRLTLPFVAA